MQTVKHTITENLGVAPTQSGDPHQLVAQETYSGLSHLCPTTASQLRLLAWGKLFPIHYPPYSGGQAARSMDRPEKSVLSRHRPHCEAVNAAVVRLVETR